MKKKKDSICECPYKNKCHILRQKCQAEIRKALNGKVEDCIFYQCLSEYELEVAR